MADTDPNTDNGGDPGAPPPFDPSQPFQEATPPPPAAASAAAPEAPPEAPPPFDPNQPFTEAPQQAAPTAHGREATVRQTLAQGSPNQAAWGSDITKTPIDKVSDDELIRQWKDVAKGLPQGLVAAITGGIAGDTEGAIRFLLNPYGVSQKTIFPTSVEGGPILGERGSPISGPAAASIPFVGPAMAAENWAHSKLAGTIGPPTSEEEAQGRQLGSMLVPFMPKWFRDMRGAEDVKAPPPEPAAPLPEAPKITTPRTDPQGRTVSPDLLPPDTPHDLPATAPAGAAKISPLQNIDPDAVEHVHNALTEAGFTPHTLDQQLEEMSPHQFGFEVAGPDTAPYRSANGIVQVGGQGGQDVSTAMRQRTLEMPQRINTILDNGFGTKEDLSTLNRAERIDQQKASSPLYKQFEALRIQPTDAIKALMPRLQAAGVFGRARMFAALDGKPWNQSFFTTGNQKVFPTAESWNYVGQALNSKIENSLGEFGRATTLTAKLMDIKTKLLDAIDNHPDPNVAGVWKAARNTFAGPEQIRTARQMGQKLLSESVDSDEVPYLTAGYSEPQMAAVRQGIRKSLADQLGRPGNQDPQVVKKLLGPNNQSKLRWVLGDEKADQLVDALTHERDMYNSKNTLNTGRVGSGTARNTVDASQWQAQPNKLQSFMGNAANFARHPIGSVVGHGLEHGNKFMESLAQNRLNRIRDDVAKIWTMQGPERDATLRWILEHGVNYGRRNSVYARGGVVRARGGAVPNRADGGDTDGSTPAPDTPPATVDPNVAAWQQSVDPATGVPRLTIHANATQTPPPDQNPPQTSPSEDENPPEGGPTPEHRGIMDQLLGLTGPRYQTWPERMVRSGVSLVHDVATGETPTYVVNQQTGEVVDNPEVIQRAQDMAGLAGGAGMGAAEEGAVGATGGRLITPQELYSPVEKAVQNAPLNKATPEQWMGYLKNQPGVKQEELDQVGVPGVTGRPTYTPEEVAKIRDYQQTHKAWEKSWPGDEAADAYLKTVDPTTINKAIEDSPGRDIASWTPPPDQLSSVTKDQMLQHVANNKLQEKELGGRQEFDELTPQEQQDVVERLRQFEGPEQFAHDYRTPAEQLEGARNWYQDFGAGGDSTSPKYSSYQLPGGENYRELLLKLPPPKTPHLLPDEADELSALLDKDRHEQARTGPPMTEAESNRLMYLQRVAGASEGNGAYTTPNAFNTNHWPDDPNTLLHMRMNDRDIPDVGKSLHLEELQSDWHQQGRKQGYQGELPTAVTVKPGGIGWQVVDQNGRLTSLEYPRAFTQDEALQRANDALHRGDSILTSNPQAVANAPFKTSWPELGLKRAITKAAQEGYDAISWTPGQQQADRYDLSQHIDSLSYNPKDGQLRGWKNEKPVLEERGITPEKLVDYIGKEPAERLLKTDQSEFGNHYLQGEDLKVGGEGMKGFYDKMLPNIANKLGKKYGAQVEYKDLEDVSNFRTTKDEDGEWWVVQRSGPGTFGPFPTQAKMQEWINDQPGSKGLGKESVKVPVLRLTPKLKEQALKGLPLFSDTSKPGAALSGVENSPWKGEPSFTTYHGTESTFKPVRGAPHGSFKDEPELDPEIASEFALGHYTTSHPDTAAFYAGSKGNIYQTELRGSPDNYLDWEKPLNRQPATVQKAIANIRSPELQELLSRKRNPNGNEIYFALTSGKNPFNAVKTLERTGIYGTKQPSVEGDVKGSVDYSIFHGSNTKITGRSKSNYVEPPVKKRSPDWIYHENEKNKRYWSATDRKAWEEEKKRSYYLPKSTGGSVGGQEEVQQRAAGGRVIAKEINHKPSGAQKAAGNYKKEHVRIHGLDITIENAKGAFRSGVGKEGRPWRCRLAAHYGYVRGTEGSDGDHVDVYLGPHIKSPRVWIIDQVDADTKAFDEHKVMIGFGSKQQCINIYSQCFSDDKGKDRIGAIHEMSIEAFKNWLKSGDTTKPLSGAVSTKSGKLTREAFQYTAKATSNDQCQVCKYTSGNVSKSQGCGLYRMINQRCPEDFDLNPNIDPKGWCSGWRTRNG